MKLRVRSFVGVFAAGAALLLSGCYEMPGETHAKASPASAAARNPTVAMHDAGARPLTPIDVEDADHGIYVREHNRAFAR